MGLGIGLELAQAVDEVRPRNRIATDADTRRDADATLLQLVQRLIRQRSRPGDDADVRSASRRQGSDLTGGDADVALSRADDARAVRTEQTRPGEVADERVVHARLVLGRDALGDADDEGDACTGRFEDGGGCSLRWHGNERRVGAGCGNGFGNGVENGDALDVGATLAGRHTADDLGAIGLVAQAVVLALSAGESLDDDFGVLIDKNRHDYFPFPVPFAMATAARAASSMVGLLCSTLSGMPALARI